MKTILVWVLVIYMGTGSGGGPLVVDNLATEADCLRMARRVEQTDSYHFDSYSCTQVRKVVAHD